MLLGINKLIALLALLHSQITYVTAFVGWVERSDTQQKLTRYKCCL